jgi:hypothetical protein
MLAEIFGMEWHEIHEEAERLEHAVSPGFEAKLKEKLGETGFCPHGNSVLAESPAQHKAKGETPLSRWLAFRSGIRSCCCFCIRQGSGRVRGCAWSGRTTIKLF